MAETTSRLQIALNKMIDQQPHGDLVLRTGLKEQKHTRRAARLALPSILENMGNLSRSPDGARVLQDCLEQNSWKVDRGEDCAQLAADLYGGRLPRAAEQLCKSRGNQPQGRRRNP